MSFEWTALLANAAIAALFIMVWTNLRIERLAASPLLQEALVGALMGIAAIIMMLAPVHLASGIFVDLRVAPLALAAIFGGPVAAAFSALPVAIFRAYLGGAGALPGVTSIVVASFVAMLFHYRNRQWKIGPAGIAGEALAVVCLHATALYLLLPTVREQFVSRVLGPIYVVEFLAVFLGGVAIHNEIRRRETMRTNRIYRQVIESLPDCLNIKDLEGRFLIANQPTAALVQAASAADLIGKTDFDFHPPEVAAGFLADEKKIIASGKPAVLEEVVRHADGTIIWLSTLKAPVFDNQGRPIGLITHNRNIGEQKRLERELSRSQRNFADAVTNMPDGLAMFDHDGMLVFCNSQYRDMFGKVADLLTPGRPYRDILLTAIQRGAFSTSPFTLQSSLIGTPADLLQATDRVHYGLADGRWLKVRTRFTENRDCFVVCSDITQLKRKEAKLVELNTRLSVAAVTDGLTGLANRRAFDQYLQNEIKRASRGTVPLSLVIVDVDSFKSYNDTYGHPAGDTTLQKIAECLREVTKRPSDMAARYGGEELAAVLPLTSREQAEALALRVRGAVRNLGLEHMGSEKGVVTVSVGVATLEGQDATVLSAADFVRRADEALYIAKRAGRDVVRCWSSEPSDPALKTA